MTLRSALTGVYLSVMIAMLAVGCNVIPGLDLRTSTPEATPDLAETMYWLVDDASMRLSTQMIYEIDQRFKTLAPDLVRLQSEVTALPPGVTPDAEELLTSVRETVAVTSVVSAIRTRQAADAKGIHTTDCENRMTFVSDVTVPDYSSVTAKKPFTKTWRVRNTGTCTWTEDYSVVFEMGDRMNAAERTKLPAGTVVQPNETLELSVYMTAPEKPGSYAGYWKLEDGFGARFGTGSDNSKALWVKVEVR